MKPTQHQPRTPAPVTPQQPGRHMAQLLTADELKQVGGGRSGPSPRGAGH